MLPCLLTCVSVVMLVCEKTRAGRCYQQQQKGDGAESNGGKEGGSGEGGGGGGGLVRDTATRQMKRAYLFSEFTM